MTIGERAKGSAGTDFGGATFGFRKNLQEIHFANKVYHLHHFSEVSHGFVTEVFQNWPPALRANNAPALIKAMLRQGH